MSNRLSNFDRKEKFDYKTIPYHFESVSQEGLKELGKECAQNIKDNFSNEMNPATVRAMLDVISSTYNNAYAELEGDYNARRTRLDEVYSEGLKDLYDRIKRFRLLVDEHNQTFKQYSTALYNATETLPDRKLYYSESNIEEIENNYKKLRRD